MAHGARPDPADRLLATISRGNVIPNGQILNRAWPLRRRNPGSGRKARDRAAHRNAMTVPSAPSSKVIWLYAEIWKVVPVAFVAAPMSESVLSDRNAPYTVIAKGYFPLLRQVKKLQNCRHRSKKRANPRLGEQIIRELRQVYDKLRHPLTLGKQPRTYIISPHNPRRQRAFTRWEQTTNRPICPMNGLQNRRTMPPIGN